MKKKFFAVLLATTLTLSSSTFVFADEKDDKIAELETKIKDLESQIDKLKGKSEKSDSTTSDFSYDQDGYTYKFLKSQVVEDSSFGKCVYIFYNFTNNSDQTCSAANALISKAFQNGVELDYAYPDYSNDVPKEYENIYKDIQTGGSVDVAFMYALSDDSDISIEITPIAYTNDTPIGTYTFKLNS